MFGPGVDDVHTTTQGDEGFGHFVDGGAVHVKQGFGVFEGEGVALDFEVGFIGVDAFDVHGVAGEGEGAFL